MFFCLPANTLTPALSDVAEEKLTVEPFAAAFVAALESCG